MPSSEYLARRWKTKQRRGLNSLIAWCNSKSNIQSLNTLQIPIEIPNQIAKKIKSIKIKKLWLEESVLLLGHHTK